MSTPSDRRPRLGALVRAVWLQSAADLRPVLLGSGVFSLLLAAGVIVTVGRMSNGLVEAYTAYGPMFVAGSVGALSGLITMQIASETFTDRVGGALLRVRILPHGPLVWTISKTVTALVHTMATQLAVLLGAALFVSALPLSVAQVLECVPFIILSSLAAAPLGIAAACASRGMYSLMVTLLPIMALVATSGAFFPVVALPRWLQLIHLALPTYWSGHLTRWALVDDPSWEIGGAFRPEAALTVLVAWTVVGLGLLAPALVRRSFRRESIGNLARMQSAARSQTGT